MSEASGRGKKERVKVVRTCIAENWFASKRPCAPQRSPSTRFAVWEAWTTTALCTVATAWRTRGSSLGFVNHATACLCMALNTKVCASAVRIGCFCV